MTSRFRRPPRAIRATTLLALAVAVMALAAPLTVDGAAVQAKLAYATGTERSTPAVWVANADGGRGRRLGPGIEPLLAPSGRWVAASVVGPTTGAHAWGPALVIYSTSGDLETKYLQLAVATAQPLAWSSDSRYLAVALQSTSADESGSGLVVIDMSTKVATTIAKGQVEGASFAPDGSDRIVYGLAPTLETNASVNLYIAQPNGSGTQTLTSDGRSLNPVWGPRWIAYDKERLRPNWAPRYDVWLRVPGSASARRLTNVPANKLVVGLVPLAFSANGTRLLSEFEGQDTSAAWTVRVPSGSARPVRAGKQSVVGAGISQDGATLLVDIGSFESPPSSGRVATVPFAGGPPKVLVARGAQASWNR